MISQRLGSADISYTSEGDPLVVQSLCGLGLAGLEPHPRGTCVLLGTK